MLFISAKPPQDYLWGCNGLWVREIRINSGRKRIKVYDKEDIRERFFGSNALLFFNVNRMEYISWRNSVPRTEIRVEWLWPVWFQSRGEGGYCGCSSTGSGRESLGLETGFFWFFSGGWYCASQGGVLCGVLRFDPSLWKSSRDETWLRFL